MTVVSFDERYIPTRRKILNITLEASKFLFINLMQSHSNIQLAVCQEWRITFAITHNTLTPEDASSRPIAGCTLRMKCRLESNCHHRYSIRHADYLSSYYAKWCVEIPVCLYLVHGLWECDTATGNSEWNSIPGTSTSDIAGIKW